MLADNRSKMAVAACAVAIFTYIVCIIITVSNGTYIGGIPWPYFSDTGRDVPAYFLFAIGLTVVCLLYIPVSLVLLHRKPCPD